MVRGWKHPQRIFLGPPSKHLASPRTVCAFRCNGSPLQSARGLFGHQFIAVITSKSRAYLNHAIQPALLHDVSGDHQSRTFDMVLGELLTPSRTVCTLWGPTKVNEHCGV